MLPAYLEISLDVAPERWGRVRGRTHPVCTSSCTYRRSVSARRYTWRAPRGALVPAIMRCPCPRARRTLMDELEAEDGCLKLACRCGAFFFFFFKAMVEEG